jgi:hypothetical protein
MPLNIGEATTRLIDAQNRASLSFIVRHIAEAKQEPCKYWSVLVLKSGDPAGAMGNGA